MGKGAKKQGNNDDSEMPDKNTRFVRDAAAPKGSEMPLEDQKAELQLYLEELSDRLGHRRKELERSPIILENFSAQYDWLTTQLEELITKVDILNISEAAKNAAKKIEKFRNNFKSLNAEIEEFFKEIYEFKPTEETRQPIIREMPEDKWGEISEPPVPEVETVPAVPEPEPEPEEAPEPSEPIPTEVKPKPEEKPAEKPAAKQEKAERKNVTFVFENGVFKTPDFSIDLKPIVEGAKYNMTIDRDGWLAIESKQSKWSARLGLREDGKTVLIRTPVYSGSFLPAAAIGELQSIFRELQPREEKPPKEKKSEEKAVPVEKKEEKPAPEPVKPKEEKPIVIETPPEPPKKIGEPKVEKIEAPIEISREKLEKVVNYLEDVVSDGNADSNYQKWIDKLRTHLPERPDESEEMKAKRKLVDEAIFQDTLRTVTKHLKLMHEQKQAESLAAIKTGDEKAKWQKRKEVLGELFAEEGAKEAAPKMEELVVVEEKPLPEPEPVKEQPPHEEPIVEKPKEESPVESETEKARKIAEQAVTEGLIGEETKQSEVPAEAAAVMAETEIPAEQPAIAVPEEINLMENAGAIREHFQKKEELNSRLIAAREKLKDAFAKKEKSAGWFSRAQTREAANAEFESAWNEYSALQKEMIETNQLAAGELRNFLHEESSRLQGKLGEYYKGKENVISKVWRRLGEMNLYNFLERKGAEVSKNEELGEAIGSWDRFWANRAIELKQSNVLYKMGAKALSVRLGLSMGLLGAGLFGIPGAAVTRGAFVGLGAAFGSRQLEDAVQNKMQRWLGNRGEFFGTSGEAKAAMRDKYGVVEQTFDRGAPADETEDKKMAWRRAKYEKELGSAEAAMIEFETLAPAEKLSKIQEKIAAIEAYAYVNGLDLAKDKNYQRLLSARDRTTEEFLTVKAAEAGDERPVVRPDDLKDALAFLENRKLELGRTAEKVSSEKRTRWAKRIVAATIGVAAGTAAYFATLSRAEMFDGHKAHEAVAAATHPEGAPLGEAGVAPEAPVSAPGAEVSHAAIAAEVQPSPADIAAIEQFNAATHNDPEAIVAFTKAIEGGHPPQAIADSFLVHKGDGIERVLQRQLLVDPKNFGYDGDPNDIGAVHRWAGHEASVIAQKTGLDEKYFIFKPKEPQYLILNKDGSINIIGKLHDESEIIAARAREAAAVMGEGEKPAPGETVPVREVIDIKTGAPKFLTDVEQAEYQILMDKGQAGDAMEFMIEHKAHGPVFEMPDGTEVHRADVGEWEGGAPEIKVSSGATVEPRYIGFHNKYYGIRNMPDAYDESEHQWHIEFVQKFRAAPEGTPGHEELMAALESHNLVTDSQYAKDLREALYQTNPNSAEHGAIVNSLKNVFAEFETRTGKSPEMIFDKQFVTDINNATEYKGAPLPAVETPVHVAAEAAPAEAFGGHPLHSFEGRYGKTEFSYDDSGEVKGYQMKIRDGSYSEARRELFSKSAEFIPDRGTVIKIQNLGARDELLKEMNAQGLANSPEADYIKAETAAGIKQISKSIGQEPKDLFNEATLKRYGLSARPELPSYEEAYKGETAGTEAH